MTVAGAEDPYADILALGYLFFEGQMSGDLPAWNRLTADKPGGYKRVRLVQQWLIHGTWATCKQQARPL